MSLGLEMHSRGARPHFVHTPSHKCHRRPIYLNVSTLNKFISNAVVCGAKRMYVHRFVLYRHRTESFSQDWRRALHVTGWVNFPTLFQHICEQNMKLNVVVLHAYVAYMCVWYTCPPQHGNVLQRQRRIRERARAAWQALKPKGTGAYPALPMHILEILVRYLFTFQAV